MVSVCTDGLFSKVLCNSLIGYVLFIIFILVVRWVKAGLFYLLIILIGLSGVLVVSVFDLCYLK